MGCLGSGVQGLSGICAQVGGEGGGEVSVDLGQEGPRPGQGQAYWQGAVAMVGFRLVEPGTRTMIG